MLQIVRKHVEELIVNVIPQLEIACRDVMLVNMVPNAKKIVQQVAKVIKISVFKMVLVAVQIVSGLLRVHKHVQQIVLQVLVMILMDSARKVVLKVNGVRHVKDNVMRVVHLSVT